MAEKITIEKVKHVAHLARLKLSDAEIARFGPQLDSIIGYVDKLGEVDTTNIEPTAHPLPIRNVFRDDTPTDSMTPDAALANAPARDIPFFKVPKVLDQETA